MSFRSKRELLVQTALRYQQASHAHKSVILDEFVAATGYARKYAIRLLTPMPFSAPTQIRRPRAPYYGADVQAALEIAWSATNFVGTKRLVPFLPKLVPLLERHGHLTLSDELRSQLLTLSPATADRLLHRARTARQPRGIATTKAGSLLKRQIPVRTFADWDEASPGFCEADLVAHWRAVVEAPPQRVSAGTDRRCQHGQPHRRSRPGREHGSSRLRGQVPTAASDVNTRRHPAGPPPRPH